MRKKRTFKELHQHTCLDCGINFQSVTRRRAYCSSKCNHRAHYQKHMLDYNWRLKRLHAQAKYRAIKKKLPFTITAKDLITLWKNQRGCCCLTGVEFNLGSWGDYRQVHPDAPSVDRIEPAKGYVFENIRLVTYHMNTALTDFGIKEFERLMINYTKISEKN